MTRIHIGEKNGRMGFWIAPPGGDASGEGKMLVSSDLDYLKLHAFGKLRVNGLWDDVDGGYGYNETPVLFPALPYRPLIFVSFQWENEWIEYPMSTNPSHWEFDDHIPTGVETDRIVLFKGGAASGRYKPYVDVSYQVFKNKLAAA